MSAHPNTRFPVALHVVTLLADRPDDVISSEMMAGSVGTNPVHLRRVLAGLREAGLVESRPGQGGGWRLTAEAGDITLGDVWRATRGDDVLIAVHQGTNPQCPIGSRMDDVLGDVVERVDAAVQDTLDGSTVADLLTAARRRSRR